MSEYEIKLKIEPENYDYGEEEIVYRIFINGQLICERALPKLTQNQKFFDCFSLKLDDSKTNNLIFNNLKTKTARPTKIFIDDLSFNLPKNGKKINFMFKNLAFSM